MLAPTFERPVRFPVDNRELQSARSSMLGMITPALTERTKGCEFVKLSSDTMGGYDHPTTWPTVPQRTLRFNDLLSRVSISFEIIVKHLFSF